MSYYRTCPRCGAHLAPGEICDCLDVEARLLLAHLDKKDAAPSAANTESGKAEQTLTDPVSASNDTRD